MILVSKLEYHREVGPSRRRDRRLGDYKSCLSRALALLQILQMQTATEMRSRLQCCRLALPSTARWGLCLQKLLVSGSPGAAASVCPELTPRQRRERSPRLDSQLKSGGESLLKFCPCGQFCP